MVSGDTDEVTYPPPSLACTHTPHHHAQAPSLRRQPPAMSRALSRPPGSERIGESRPAASTFSSKSHLGDDWRATTPVPSLIRDATPPAAAFPLLTLPFGPIPISIVRTKGGGIVCGFCPRLLSAYALLLPADSDSQSESGWVRGEESKTVSEGIAYNRECSTALVILVACPACEVYAVRPVCLTLLQSESGCAWGSVRGWKVKEKQGAW